MIKRFAFKIKYLYCAFLIPLLTSKVYAYASGVTVDENGNYILAPPDSIYTPGTVTEQGFEVIDILNIFLNGIQGIAALFLVGLFAWKAFLLATSSNSPNERQKNIKALFYVGIAAVILGGIRFIVGLAYNALA